MAELSKATKALVVGNGMDESTDLGPIQNAMQYERLKDFVASIKRDKLTIAVGDLENTFSTSKGYYMSPLLIDNPPEDSRAVVEEPFGKQDLCLLAYFLTNFLTRTYTSCSQMGHGGRCPPPCK